MYHLDNSYDLEKCLCFPSWKGIRDPPDPPALGCTFCPAARPGALVHLMAAQEPTAITFFRVRSGPRELQEAPKSYSEASASKNTIRAPFWSHFGGPK